MEAPDGVVILSYGFSIVLLIAVKEAGILVLRVLSIILFCGRLKTDAIKFFGSFFIGKRVQNFINYGGG